MRLDAVGCGWMQLDAVGCSWMQLDAVGCSWVETGRIWVHLGAPTQASPRSNITTFDARDPDLTLTHTREVHDDIHAISGYYFLYKKSAYI